MFWNPPALCTPAESQSLASISARRGSAPYALTYFADVLAGLGIVFWKTKRYPEAQQHLPRALSICKKKTCGPWVEPSAYFAMADMLWKEGQQRSRAVNLAKKARQGFAKVLLDVERSEVETWLKARGVKLEPMGEAAEEIAGGGETGVSVHER